MAFLSRRGVSPIIATLMLILIAVSAAVVTYSYVNGYIGGFHPGDPSFESISIDHSAYADGNVSVFVRNLGSAEVVVDAAYVGRAQGVDFIGSSVGQSLGVHLAPGSVVELDFSAPGLALGYCEVKVVCLKGGYAIGGFLVS